MKKILAFGAAILFAGSAFAEEVKKGPEFRYNIWANAFAVTEDTVKKNEQKQYSNIRVRPVLTLTNEKVSVITGLEIDQYFGAKYTTTSFGNDVSYSDPDGDEKAVEVKWAYINVKDMIVTGLSVTTGLAPYVYSVGFNNDMPMLNFIYDAGVVKFDLAYIKFVEGSTTEHSAANAVTGTSGALEKDDAEAYAAKLLIKLGDITITPSVLYFSGKKNVLTPSATGISYLLGYDQKLTMPALGVAAVLGDISFNADFQYITGKQKDYPAETTKKVNAYAGYLNGGFKASDSLEINLFGLYSTGEDARGNTTTSFQSASQDEIEVGPMFIINDSGFINQVGVSNEFDKATEGIIMGGLSAGFKLEKFTVLAQMAYARTTSRKVDTNAVPGTGIKKSVIGTEMDLRLSYEVATGTSIWAEGAFLAAGNYNKEKFAASGKQNPVYYAAGLMTKI